MTDYSKIPARELDALVAREVMGWECDAGYAGEPIWWRGSSEFVRVADFRPSTDGRAMLTVLDALRERGCGLRFFVEPSDGIWVIDIQVRDYGPGGFPNNTNFRHETVSAHTLPRALCEAALAAVGGK